jgi:hypothetical protein
LSQPTRHLCRATVPRGRSAEVLLEGKGSPVSITDRLTDKDPEVRAKAAGDLAVAASGLAEAARVCRDRDARELLRRGVRPAEVGRTITMSRAQMVRYKVGEVAPSRREVTMDAARVDGEITTLLTLLNDTPAALRA